MFRSRPGRACWHFCENCPYWPWHCDSFDEQDDPPRERWCKTCVRLYEANVGELPWPWSHSIFIALCNAWSAGKLNLKEEDG